MNLFNLFATLTLDNSDYEKKLDQSQKSAGSFSSKVGTAFKTGVRAVAGFVTSVVAATTAIGALAVNFINAGSEIDDNAQKLGISTEAYQYWSLVLQRAGSDASQLSMAIRNMTTFTQELSEGNADALLTLQKLGIGYEDFMAMNTEEQLYAIVTALQGMEDQTDKVTIAQDIFGNRVYQELLPLLNMEQGSLQDLQAEFEELGLIMSDDTVKGIAAVGDSLDNLGNIIKTTGLVIASDFLPEIQDVVTTITDLINGSIDAQTAMNKLGDSIADILTKILASAPDFFNAGADLILSLIDGLANAISDKDFTTKLSEFVSEFLGKIASAIPLLIADAGKIAGAIIDTLINVDWGDLLRKLISSTVQTLVNLPNILNDMLQPILDLFFTDEGREKLFNFGLDILYNIGAGIIDGLGDTLDTIWNIIKLYFSNKTLDINGMIIGGSSSSNSNNNSTWDNFAEGWHNFWGDVGDFFSNAFKSPSNNSFGFGFGLGFADGGMFPGKGTIYALAGEAGAEIVARGSRGTGVANVEQIADAQYMAMQDYDLRGAIQGAAVAIVNGVVDGLSNTTQDSRNTPVVIRIGDRDFNGYIVNTVNNSLRAQGRKSLNRITAYGKG